MTRTRTRAGLAALPLALMLALTGCGSDDAGNGNDVASANGGSQNDGSREASAPPSADEIHQMQLDFADCLREHGLDLDDPKPGEGIQLPVETEPRQADAALEACEHLLPRPPAGAPDEGEERGDMLEYAQCMRDNDVEKFADPKPGEGIDIGPEVVEDPDFERAQETCDEVFGVNRERVERPRGE